MRNWDKPMNEFFNKFLPWNNTGGRSWADMSREQRAAAAVQWRQKTPTPPRFPPQFLDMWKDIVRSLADAPAEVMWAALDDGLKWKRESNGSYILHCKQCLYEYIEHHMDIFKPIICKTYGMIHLQYVIYDDNPQ